VQGLGAAVTAPAAVALIIVSFPAGRRRSRALGVFSAMGALGFSLGVVVGGLATTLFGWRGGFLLYVPLAVLVVAVARWRLVDPSSGPPLAAKSVPWVQMLAATSGFLLLAYAIGRTGSTGLGSVTVFGAAGIILIVGFLLWQRRSPQPLLPVYVLAEPSMGAACAALGFGFAAVTATLFRVATSLQEHDGYSAFAAGLAFLPQGIAVGVLSTPAARAVERRGAATVLTAGLVLLLAGQVWYLFAERGSYTAHLLPAAVLVGAGIALIYPAAVATVAALVSDRDQGTASGMLTACQQAGGAVGVAVVTAIGASNASTLWGIALPLWGCLGFAVLAVLIGVTMLTWAHGRRSQPH